MLSRIYGSEGGPETLDVLMKYLYAVQVRAYCPYSISSGYSIAFHMLIMVLS